MEAIRASIEAVQAARLEWAKNDAVYAKLGDVLRHLRIAERKAQKEIEKTYVLRGN